MESYKYQELRKRNKEAAIRFSRIYQSKNLSEYNLTSDEREREAEFIKKYMDSYSNKVGILFSEIITDKEFSAEEKETFVKEMFKPHLVQFLRIFERMRNDGFKTGNHIGGKTYDSYLMEKFLEVDFGHFVDNEYKISEIARLYQNNDILSNYSPLLTYLNTTYNSIMNHDYDNTIFVNKVALDLLNEFMKEFCIDPYSDISFIFQQMKKDHLLRNVPHKEFMCWLKDEKLIREKDYDKIYGIGNFKSLDKSTSSARLNHYFRLKEKYLEL
ncbi:hypothetical protein [Moheibacter sediminis]|uniref:Uncharacterized protein n=1 Tax=Moheibacter sediminis TaxID=1434700 RepID=A0A1W2BRC7_9FLAO|nr:hypothetical protein [Moheibacter sediminis]SMC75503.1 hypothetical protein SAMN06296427_10774 [Moheibacter sediminis]